MLDRLEKMKERFENINQELANIEINSNFSDTKKLMQEQKNLEKAVSLYKKYEKNEKIIKENQELLSDEEIKEVAQEEIKMLRNQNEEIIKQLEIELLPKDPNDEKNIIMEIRGAAGGDEANIFAGDLFKAYSKYAAEQNWKVEILNANEATAGGFTLIEFMITGENVYSHLKYESGSHRVQRVPATETQGRIHTSTATVLVMPEAQDVDIEINDNDIKIDVFRSGGAGGQSVNTTDSAVRITHLPSNIVVTCQNERSQLKNKEQAMKILKARLFEKQLADKEEKEGLERKSKIGTGDRSEKIRTYNYPQNRVTDHRINYTTKQLDRVMEGKLGEIINALINEDQKRKLTDNV